MSHKVINWHLSRQFSSDFKLKPITNWKVYFYHFFTQKSFTSLLTNPTFSKTFSHPRDFNKTSLNSLTQNPKLNQFPWPKKDCLWAWFLRKKLSNRVASLNISNINISCKKIFVLIHQIKIHKSLLLLFFRFELFKLSRCD